MKEPRKRKGAKRARAKRLFEDNPLYGKIPLLARSYPLGTTGKTYTAYEYDLDYARLRCRVARCARILTCRTCPNSVCPGTITSLRKSNMSTTK